MLEVHDYLVSSSDPREKPREVLKNHFEAASDILLFIMSLKCGRYLRGLYMLLLIPLECILLNTILTALKQTEKLASDLEKVSLI